MRFRVMLYFCLLTSSSLIGNSLIVCGSCQLTDLAEAHARSEAGDTIFLRPGVYEMEKLSIEKPLSIIGVNNPVLRSRSGDEILTVLAHNVTIQGITFKDVTTSYLKERSAIRILRKKNFVLLNNTIQDCFFGIYLEHAANGKISGNMIKGDAKVDREAESGNGIHGWYSKDLEIVENTITGHRDGIYLEFVNQSIIRDNRSFENHRYGLHFMFSNDNQYLNNTFRKNGVGVAVMFSRRIKMIGNEFVYNWGRASYGLLLKEIFDAEIKENRFEQNTTGIFVEGSNRIDYQNNDFVENGWAIKFSGGCEEGKVTNNNFVNNSLDLVINTKISSNEFHHNYWSEYAGYDLDHDGIGDVPHFPVKLFSYIIDQVPEAIVLMRSLFVDLINLTEKVSPVFTPKDVRDPFPLMQPVL